MVDNIKVAPLRKLTHVIGHAVDGKGGRMEIGQVFTARFGTIVAGNDALLGTVVASAGFTTNTAGVGGGTRVLIPLDGIYLISARTPNKAAPTVSLEIQVILNNGTILASGLAPLGAGDYAPANITAFAVALVAGDFVHLRNTSAAGGANDVSLSYNMFSIAKIG